VEGSTDVTLYARVGGTDGYYPGIVQGGVYYLNIENAAWGSSTCGVGESCNMYIDFVKQ